MEKRHQHLKSASAHDFPKFVKVGAEVEHELRKVGTRQSLEHFDDVIPDHAF